MKKIFLFAPLVLLLAVMGCKKLDQLLTFNVDVAQSVVIPGYLVGAQLPPVKVTTRSEDSFRNNKTTRDKVKNVLLDKLTLTVTNPAGTNFNFLDRIELYISTTASNKILLAKLYTVPRGVTTVTLEPTTAKLDEYLKSDTYDLTAVATVNGFNPDDFTVRSDATFKVTANPL